MTGRFPRNLAINSSDPAEVNQGVKLFGRRLIRDQTPLEFLTELLLVAFSPRQIGNEDAGSAALPSISTLQSWPAGESLSYSPQSRIGLKLFALLGVSRLEARHASHREHYEKTLLPALGNGITTGTDLSQREVLQTLENLLLGFVGVGQNRGWCAQTFLPLRSEFLAGEAIWNESLARRIDAGGTGMSWADLLEQPARFFTMSRHRFMARGGEVLFLQLCNVFRQPQEQIDQFVASSGLGESLDQSETNLKALHRRLCSGLQRVMEQVPAAVGRIARWIDGIDEETQSCFSSARERVNCYWVPEETWRESFLFAIELSRLCHAALDPIERIDLLTMACAMQVLRTMSAQTIRHLPAGVDIHPAAGASLGYAWIASPVRCPDRTRRDLAQRSLHFIQDAIFRTLRSEEFGNDEVKKPTDDKYGHGLFLSLAKRTGLVIPPRGSGARFVLDDRWMRYLVLSIIGPGRRRNLQGFLQDVYRHTGIVIDGTEFDRACDWVGMGKLEGSEAGKGEWFESMLREGGFLHELSDAYSLVENPFSYSSETEEIDGHGGDDQ